MRQRENEREREREMVTNKENDTERERKKRKRARVLDVVLHFDLSVHRFGVQRLRVTLTIVGSYTMLIMTPTCLLDNHLMWTL